MPTTDRVTVQPSGELAALRAENDRLKGQLAQATARTANAAPAKPYLTEGERQELITFGRSGNLTLSQARAKFPDADLADATDVAKRADAEPNAERTAIRGFDFVYPSVAPGVLAEDQVGAPGTTGTAK